MLYCCHSCQPRFADHNHEEILASHNLIILSRESYWYYKSFLWPRHFPTELIFPRNNLTQKWTDQNTQVKKGNLKKKTLLRNKLKRTNSKIQQNVTKGSKMEENGSNTVSFPSPPAPVNFQWLSCLSLFLSVLNPFLWPIPKNLTLRGAMGSLQDICSKEIDQQEWWFYQILSSKNGSIHVLKSKWVTKCCMQCQPEKWIDCTDETEVVNPLSWRLYPQYSRILIDPNVDVTAKSRWNLHLLWNLPKKIEV